MRAIGRSLDDLPHRAVFQTWGVGSRRPLAWAALGVLTMLAFVLWLALGPPAPQMAAPRQTVTFSTPESHP
ncbi:MAG: hypothetical protein ACHP7N_04905 [Caulobacterales bacterium]